jgi:hypothetical protein
LFQIIRKEEDWDIDEERPNKSPQGPSPEDNNRLEKVTFYFYFRTMQRIVGLFFSLWLA